LEELRECALKKEKGYVGSRANSELARNVCFWPIAEAISNDPVCRSRPFQSNGTGRSERDAKCLVLAQGARARIEVPMGYAEFPKEILRPPRSLALSMYNRHSSLDEDAKGRALRCA
jgi:hypothetical protein